MIGNFDTTTFDKSLYPTNGTFHFKDENTCFFFLLKLNRELKRILLAHALTVNNLIDLTACKAKVMLIML